MLLKKIYLYSCWWAIALMVGRQKFHYRRKHAEDAAQWQFSVELVRLRIKNENRETVQYLQGMIHLQVAIYQNNKLLWRLLKKVQVFWEGHKNFLRTYDIYYIYISRELIQTNNEYVSKQKRIFNSGLKSLSPESCKIICLKNLHCFYLR